MANHFLLGREHPHRTDPIYLTPIKIRSLYISLHLIFAPLESNLLPLIFAPLIDLLFFAHLIDLKESFKELMRFKMDPKVINFCGINSAQIFFSNFGDQFTPFHFRSPYFWCPIRSL